MEGDANAIVRPAEDSDVPDILRLLEQLFLIEADFSFAQERQQKGVELLLSNKDACVLVADFRGKVVGVITVQRLISTAEGGYVGLVEDVSVETNFRCQGIGKQLERAACDWASTQGLLRLQLLADSSNSPALNFYSKAGWNNTSLIALRKAIT
ncbi:hypothetical protein WJX75_006187 [Coccomyxa subellipsoidea]|uniref:N-acetyltransferase domain-containing protein n=1 Tax=Coccomyxa subellipsoidea TaxID=248742 RepID=A0ABR2YX84_9CHLO